VEDLEETLQNIDVFCRILVEKIAEEEEHFQDIVVEPIEKPLRRKYIKEDDAYSSLLAKHLIPLPEAEEPLIDVFENDTHIKILMQCRCEDQETKVHRDIDGLQVCTDKCRKLYLPVKHLQIDNMSAKCNNNKVLEIAIPKQ
jgi:hypothetical protein